MRALLDLRPGWVDRVRIFERKLTTWPRRLSDGFEKLARRAQHLGRGHARVVRRFGHADDIARDIRRAGRDLLHVARDLLRRRTLLFHRRGGDNPAREVLRLFFRESSEKLGRLYGDNASPDAKTAQCYAHSLKSAAAAFGFKSLSVLAQSLEAEAHNLTALEIAARAQSLDEALANARGFSRLQ